MNYEEALNYIHAVQWAGHKPGLTRTRLQGGGTAAGDGWQDFCGEVR